MKKVFILAVTIGSVAITYLYPHIMINPGEMTEGHQNLNNKCLSCHAPFKGISNNKCISCHKLSEIGKDTIISIDTISNKIKIQFHESLINQDCIACHSDHKGIDPNLSLSKFKHLLLTSSVKNYCLSCHKTPDNELHKQLSADCKSCHNTTDWKASTTFNHELIVGLNKNNCTSCHQSPKDTLHQSVKNNCNECHTTAKWLPSTFNHSSFFVLDKDHSPDKCSTCHVNNDFKKYNCYGCHEHSQANISTEHSEEGISNFKDCVSCHKSANEKDIRMPYYNKNNSGQTNYKKSNREEDGDDD